MFIELLIFNPFKENTYIVWDETLEAVVIDPGCSDRFEQDELKDFITKNNLTVKLLLNTHCHIDHVLGNSFVKDTYQAPLLIHQLDLPILKAVKTYAPNYGFVGYQEAEPDGFLNEGDVIKFGNSSFEVLFVPGHAPGHVAFVNREQNICIGGDVLFRGSIGRTDFPGCSFEALVDSIQHKIFTLSDEMVVYPGHGSTTTVGHERQWNPFVGENARLGIS